MKEENENVHHAMTLDEYEQKAMSTCLASCENFSYMMLNLVGELGETASKYAKAIRKEEMEIHRVQTKNGKDIRNHIWLTDSFVEEENGIEAAGELCKGIQYELGDILWQLTGLIHVSGWTLQDIAEMNLVKLSKRKDEDKIIGDGDYR